MVEEIEWSTCPAAIATTYTSKTSRGVKELRNILFPYDPDARVEASRHPDVILIYTRIPKDLIKKIVSAMRPSAVARLVVADKCIKISRENYFSQIIEACIDLASRNTLDSFYVDCRSRGDVVESCRLLEIEIGRLLEARGLGKVSFKNPSRVLRIEVIDDVALISLMNPSEDRLKRIFK